MAPAYPPRARRSPQFANLALDLGLDVERLLARPLPPRVAGDHELADLLAQGGVHGRGGQTLQLRLHVERRLAPPLPSLVAGHQHLADLGVTLGHVDRGAASPARARDAVL